MKLGDAWEMGILGSFVSARIAQLNETPMINQVDHYVRLTRNVTLPPMQVHKMVGVAKIPILSKRLNVMTESLLAREAIEGIEAVPSYETFKQGGNRVTIGLQNLTREKIILKKGTKIARVSAANIVPLCWLQTRVQIEMNSSTCLMGSTRGAYPSTKSQTRKR